MKNLENNLPIPADLTKQLSELSQQQQAFLAGYLWASSQSVGTAVAPVSDASAAARKITLISASQTGNAAGVARSLNERLLAAGLDVSLVSAGSYKARQLAKEDIVLIVTSTQGEGEPPEEAVPLHHFLFGKKALKLDGLSFAVFGLGDSSYPDFCQAGIDFDSKLAELGAERLIDRGDADVDYESAAEHWIDQAVARLSELASASTATATASVQPAAATLASSHSKDKPFTASLVQRHPLATDDAASAVAHIEIDLADSGLQYQPGDALGVIARNDSELVSAILQQLELRGDEPVTTRKGDTQLREALEQQYDLNQLTPKFISDYAQSAAAPELTALLEDRAALQAYQASTTLLGLLTQYPQSLDAQRLCDGLKPLAPRLYSIASSQAEVGEEVHLCVGLVDLPHGDQTYHGSASGLLGKRLEEGDDVEVFVEPNPRFRLPGNNDAPIIMIGAGTGIAPYRGFLQQRSADEASGRNWLIFGNRHYRRDFLYQAEWLEFREQGYLHQTSLAWSRDGEHKVYVQDRIRENAPAFWQWLQDGAHIYVCGDASRMAKDVEQAILEVITLQGGLDEDAAADYLNELRESDRYQRDVY